MANSSSNTASYGTIATAATATLIKAANPLRKNIYVQNVHATQVLYLGSNSSVATTTGLRLNAGESIKLEDYNGAVYGIASGANTDTRYFEA